MGTPVKDVDIPDKAPSKLLLNKHIDFIDEYGKKKNDFEYVMTEYLRMSGIYWGLTVMDLMNALDRMDQQEVLKFVAQCQHPCGGVGASVGHDPHLLYTLSAVQRTHPVVNQISEIWTKRLCNTYYMYIKILCLYDALDTVDVDKIVEFIQGLQQEDGSFYGDKWGEVDSRFSFCAVACLALINRLDAINVERAVDFVLSCMNFDGGFGCRPGSESHSGQIYCCVGMLAIVGRLHHVRADTLGWWLCERQLPSGGLNGRPEKLPDVCYSWWVLASLKIIGRIDWIDKDKLRRYILACQDEESGGFADRPGDMVDPFHTLFGITGLSLLGSSEVKQVNPIFCMPEETIRRLGIRVQLLEL